MWALSRVMKLRQLPAEHGCPGHCGHVMELVDGDQAVIEGLDAQLVDGEAEGGMGADQDLFRARQKLPNGLDLRLRDMLGSSIPGALQRFHLRLHRPVRPEPIR